MILFSKLNFEYGEYDDKLWDQDSKKDVYNKWDPTAPRSTRNFNPFETFKGNSPDASGIYPGEVSILLFGAMKACSLFIFSNSIIFATGPLQGPYERRRQFRFQ